MSDETETGRSWHDMGGLDAGPIQHEAHDVALWEKRVDALLVLCNVKGVFSVDGLRRALEEMGPQSFESMTYYERWVSAVARNLVDAGVFTADELGAKMAEIARRGDSYAEASLDGASG